MIKSKKEPFSSSKPKTPATKPTLPTRQSLSTNKPKITPQKEVPEPKDISKTLIKPSTKHEPPQLPIIEALVVIPEALEVIEDTEDVQKRIPKALFHKPSLSRGKIFSENLLIDLFLVLAKQINQFYGTAQLKSTSTITFK